MNSLLLLTVKKRDKILPSDPVSLTAERSPSKKVLRLEESTLCRATSDTCRANIHSVSKWDPIAPTNSMLPLKEVEFNGVEEMYDIQVLVQVKRGIFNNNVYLFM